MMAHALRRCSGLSDSDVALLQRVEEGIHITADVSRADIVLYCRSRGDEAIVVAQARPHSISSLYPKTEIGRMVHIRQEPVIFRALNGAVAQEQRDRLIGGAPVVQEAYPIRNAEGRPIGCLSIETNLIERERHRRRRPSFQRAVAWLQGMALRGDIRNASALSPFGEWDGILLVDSQLRIRYLSGIATNLYRRLGFVDDLRGRRLGELGTGDDEFVEEALRLGGCLEVEAYPKNRVWIKKAIPLKQGPRRFLPWLVLPASWWQPWKAWTTRSGYAGAFLLMHDATEVREKERELQVKSVLIKEVHHRVKNDLQAVAGMLRMQARRSSSDEVRRQLMQAVDRINSVAVIHEFLSHDQSQLINLRDVCQRIIAQVRQLAYGMNEQVGIALDGPNIYLVSQQATACALVVNECLQNALEHGFNGQRAGQIQVTLSEQGDDVSIIVRDDGRGLPENFDPYQYNTLGLQIVNTIVQYDLKGSFHLQNENGVSAEIHFRKLPLGGDESWKEPVSS